MLTERGGLVDLLKIFEIQKALRGDTMKGDK